ncbi:MAG: MFS transporter [Alphaproteobacteria bacterium]|nr:MFS transporter [Alphaproteobacteria bacterium]
MMISRYKAIFAATIGNALEYYDVMLYGFFAVKLAPLFFPTENPKISIMASLVTFAAGFLMRPLGGVFFGHIGDKFGRRYALAFAIVLVTVPTFIIGILPTYEVIGMAAPFILLLCRLLQALCVGGEYSGAAVFVIEHSEGKQSAFISGILCSSGIAGGVLGTLIGYICTLSFMPEWGWRIPFLIGSFIGLIGYYIRTRVAESPAFEATRKLKKLDKYPLLEILKTQKRNLLCTIGVGGTSLITFYIVSVYMNVLLFTKLNLALSEIMLVNLGVNLTWTLLLPVMGWLADKVGKEKVMSSSCIALFLISYPMFKLLDVEFSLQNIMVFQLVLSIIGAAYTAPNSALLTTFFPVKERHSGMGLGYALGGAVLGGTTPLIATCLVHLTGLTTSPAFYLMISGVIGFLSIHCAYKNEYNKLS